MRVLPLEVCALIVEYADIYTLSALVLVSRKLLTVTDRKRYLITTIHSAKRFTLLCEIIHRRPEAAHHIRKLVFDWNHDERCQEFRPLRGLVDLAATAFAYAFRLSSVSFLRLPPQNFIEFLGNFPTQLCTVHVLEYGAVGSSFDYERLDREDLMTTLFVPLTGVSTVRFLSPVPRYLLQTVMIAVGNNKSPEIDTLVLAVPEADFGVIQEVTLQDPETRRERTSLIDITIVGPFSKDPYTSNFFKDVPGILQRLQPLVRLSFIVPPHSATPSWSSDSSVFSQEQCFLDRLGDACQIERVVFPSGNEWKSWCELRLSGSATAFTHWEPAPLNTWRHHGGGGSASFFLEDGPKATKEEESPIHQWWWASDSAAELVEIAPPLLLESLRPPHVTPPTPWKTPYSKDRHCRHSHSNSWGSSSSSSSPYMRSTTPISSIPIDLDLDLDLDNLDGGEVDEIIVPRVPRYCDDSDSDDEGDEGSRQQLRLIDIEAHAQLERELGWNVGGGLDMEIEMDGLERFSDSDDEERRLVEDSDESGNEGDGDDVFQGRQYEMMRSSSPAPSPVPAAKAMKTVHYRERSHLVPSLFAMDDEEDDDDLPLPSTLAPLSASASASASDGEEDEDPDDEMEVSATWANALNPAKRRMSIYA